MKKHNVLVLIIMIILTSCKSSENFNGAWALKDTYDYWLTGNSEEVEATNLRIGEDTFSVLTNSIIISSQEKPFFLSVPGGKWKINSVRKIKPTLFLMELTSLSMTNATAKINIHLLHDSLIYFTINNMTEEFKLELNQSFLMLGSEHPYIRCNILD